MTDNITIKRLIYQSAHRGCKETDFYLGEFAKRYLPSYNKSELALYEAFITENDWDIYAWLTSAKPVPSNHHNKVVDQLLAFTPIHASM